jgi:hypothetical protein
MRALILSCLVAFVAPPALAQMSAAEFDAYTRGQTFYYGAGGAPYGGEEYLPGACAGPFSMASVRTGIGMKSAA